MSQTKLGWISCDTFIMAESKWNTYYLVYYANRLEPCLMLWMPLDLFYDRGATVLRCSPSAMCHHSCPMYNHPIVVHSPLLPCILSVLSECPHSLLIHGNFGPCLFQTFNGVPVMQVVSTNILIVTLLSFQGKTWLLLWTLWKPPSADASITAAAI